jgi:hypothetical protein
VATAAAALPIYPGQRILVEVRFYLLGVPTDPTVAKCYVKNPAGTLVVLTYPDAAFTRRDTGWFEANITVDQPGTWLFRGEAAGVVDANNEIMVNVSPSSFV